MLWFICTSVDSAKSVMMWLTFMSVVADTSVVFLLICCLIVSDILPDGDMKLFDEGVTVVDDTA